jgi:hypothetical protein
MAQSINRAGHDCGVLILGRRSKAGLYKGSAMFRVSRKLLVLFLSTCLVATGLTIEFATAEAVVLTCSQWNRQDHSFTVIIDKQARSVEDTCASCSGRATVLRMDNNLVEYDVNSNDGTIWRTWMYPDGNYKTQHRARNGRIIPITPAGAEGGRCKRGPRVF